MKKFQEVHGQGLKISGLLMKKLNLRMFCNHFHEHFHEHLYIHFRWEMLKHG